MQQRHLFIPENSIHPNASPLALFLKACLDGCGTDFAFASEWFFFPLLCAKLDAWEFTTIREFQLPTGMSWRQGSSLIGGKCIFYGGPSLLRMKPRCSTEYRCWLVKDISLPVTVNEGRSVPQGLGWYLDLVTVQWCWSQWKPSATLQIRI